MRNPAFSIYASPKGAEQVISAFVFYYFLHLNFQACSIFCGYTAQFVSDLVGNPKTDFLVTRLKIYLTH